MKAAKACNSVAVFDLLLKARTLLTKATATYSSVSGPPLALTSARIIEVKVHCTCRCGLINQFML